MSDMLIVLSRVSCWVMVSSRVEFSEKQLVSRTLMDVLCQKLSCHDRPERLLHPSLSISRVPPRAGQHQIDASRIRPRAPFVLMSESPGDAARGKQRNA